MPPFVQARNLYGRITNMILNSCIKRQILIKPLAFYFQINLHVDDLFTDLSDGKVLIRLLETISGEKIGAPGNS